MLERFAKLGARAEDVPYIRAFERWAASIGMNRAHQQDLIAWGLAQGPNTPPERLMDNLYDFATKRGIEVADIGLIESWRDGVAEHGLPPEAPADHASDDDRRRLAEIRADMNKPCGESEYWRSPERRDEYRTLLERVGVDQAPAPTTDASGARRSEFKALIGDRQSAYYRGPTAAALQSEYRALIESDGAGSSTQNQENEVST